MFDEICGCGKPSRYETGSGWACNKYVRCPEPSVPVSELEELMQDGVSLVRLETLINRAKRKAKGGEG